VLGLRTAKTLAKSHGNSQVIETQPILPYNIILFANNQDNALPFAMDSAKTPVKLVKVTRVLGRTGTEVI
jgi:hypothetical protein